MMRWISALLGLLLLSHIALAIPPGYRYVGSLVVSEGRHVYWYWNTDLYQLDSSGTSFVANMYARNLELNEERAFVAIIRCDSRTYRRADSKDPFDGIEPGDPVFEVWRAGCEGGRAVSLALRNERVNGIAGTNAASRLDSQVSPQPASPPSAQLAPPSPSASAQTGARPAPLANVAAAAKPGAPETPAAGRTDERRVDSCVRLVEGKGSQFGDATITNTCAFAVEVAYCYKGGRSGAYDCPSPPRRTRVDSLGPGNTRNLPEYKRGSNNGVVLVACKGTLGTVIPMLNADGGKTGCS